MKYGTENPNYRHGKYSAGEDVSDIRLSLMKASLDELLSMPLEQLTPENQCFLWTVLNERPQWAKNILRKHGIN